MAEVAFFRDQSLHDFSLRNPEKKVFACDYRYRISIPLQSKTTAALGHLSPISFSKSSKASLSLDQETPKVPIVSETAAEVPKNKEDFEQRPGDIADFTAVSADAHSEKNNVHRSNGVTQNSATEKREERDVKWEAMRNDWMHRDCATNRGSELAATDQRSKQPGPTQYVERPSRETRGWSGQAAKVSVGAKGTTLRKATERWREAEWEEQTEDGNWFGGGAEEVAAWANEEEGRSKEGSVGRGKKNGEVAVFNAEKYFWTADGWSETEEEEVGGDLPLSPLVEAGRSKGGEWRRGTAEGGAGWRRISAISEFTSPRLSTGSSLGETETLARPLAGSAATKVTSKHCAASPKVAASPSSRLANFLARFKISSATSSPSSASRKAPTSPILHLVATPSAALPPPHSASTPNKSFYSHALHLPPNGKPASPGSRIRFLRAFSSSSSSTAPAPVSSNSASASDRNPLRIRTSNSDHTSPHLISSAQTPESHPDYRPRHSQCSSDSCSFVRHDKTGADGIRTSPYMASSTSSRVYKSLYDQATSAHESTNRGGLPGSPASFLEDGRSSNDKPARSKPIGAKRNSSSVPTAFRIPFLNRKLKVHSTEKGNTIQAKEQDQRRTVSSQSTNSSSVSSNADYFISAGKGNQSLFRHLQEEQQRMNMQSGSSHDVLRRSRMGELARINEVRERRKMPISEVNEDVELDNLLRVVKGQLAATSENYSSYQTRETNKLQNEQQTSSRYADGKINSTGSEHCSRNTYPSSLQQGMALSGTCSATSSTVKHASAGRKEEFYDSDSSSDLFEIESLAAGMGFYRRDLPVYQAKDRPSVDNDEGSSAGPSVKLVSSSSSNSLTVPASLPRTRLPVV